MSKIRFTTTLDEELFFSLQNLALKLSQKEKKKVPLNELIEEGMRYILEKYDKELKN